MARIQGAKVKKICAILVVYGLLFIAVMSAGCTSATQDSKTAPVTEKAVPVVHNTTIINNTIDNRSDVHTTINNEHVITVVKQEVKVVVVVTPKPTPTKYPYNYPYYPYYGPYNASQVSDVKTPPLPTPTPTPVKRVVT